MENLYYRVLSGNENSELIYDSNSYQSEWKMKTISLFRHLVLICTLSSETNIKLESALRISNQYSYVINEINTYIQNGNDFIPLDIFLVFDEEKKTISIYPIINLIPYVTHHRVGDDAEMCARLFLREIKDSCWCDLNGMEYRNGTL